MGENIKVKRIVAYIIDAVVLGIINTLLANILGVVGLAVTLVVKAAYDPIFHMMGWGGQSIGKKFMKLKVVKEDGELSIVDLALRSFLRFCIITMVLSLIWWFLEGKTIHDTVVKTKVVEE